MGRPRKITPAVLENYVFLVGEGLSKGHAAEMIGIGRATLTKHINQDPDLKKRMEIAWYDGAEDLIEEARRRGVEGWDEEVFQRGELVGHVRKYDSNLLMFSIKGRRPEYKENPKIDVNSFTQVKFEDRSVALAEGWKVLVDAGIDPAEIAAADGREPARAELPVLEGVLAKPSDVQR